MSGYRFAVEAGHVVAFARSVGDHHAAAEGGSLIPPTFVQASAHFDDTYPLRPHPSRRWLSHPAPRTGNGEQPEEPSLHASQHFQYHAPLRVGMDLVVTTEPGRTWEKSGRRGGQLKFVEAVTEYRTPEGELVVRALSVGVHTSRPVDDQ